MAELSEYEQIRLRNIERNAALLKQLGIEKIVEPKQKPLTRKLSVGFADALPERRSERLITKGPCPYYGDSAEVIRVPKRLKVALVKPPAKRIRSPTKSPVPAPLPPQPLPNRDTDGTGTLRFADHPEFTPNLTPAEVLRMGSYGGGVFRPFRSRVTQLEYKDDYKEFPEAWFEGLDIALHVANPRPDVQYNKYNIKAGMEITDWEALGWIMPQDPRGWFQWYCRFYLGRRTVDDERQINKWLGSAGPKGTFKSGLTRQMLREGEQVGAPRTNFPVCHQTLLHFAYQLTARDLAAAAEN